MYGAVPIGYYDAANGLTGNSLQAALHEIINDHTKFPYTSSNTDVWDLIKITDEDPSNSSNVILLYTGRSQDKDENSGQHQYTWQPQEMATGTYFLRLITANQTFTQKVTYVK